MAILDVIIPTYNNKQGLYSTLFSIGVTPEVAVTIIDDCSTEVDTYDDIIECFSQFFDIKVLRLKENCGPGVARQYGLDHTFNEFITFIDCGDIFYSPHGIHLMIDSLEANSDYNFCSFAHYDDNNEDQINLTYTNNNHNRIHGKIYRRSFIKKYNIRFCKDNIASRANEDICFNILCRMLCENEQRDNIGYNDYASVIWKKDNNSLSRRENAAFYYREQNLGLAKNFEHILKIAKQNNVSKEIIRESIYDMFASIHVFYLSTKNRRPEFIKESLEGAQYFYTHCFKQIHKIDYDALRIHSYRTISATLSDWNDPLYDNFCSLDILDFINMLEKGEN